MHDFTGLVTELIKEIMKEIVEMAKKKVGGESFQDTDLREIQELINHTRRIKTIWWRWITSKPVSDDEELPENKLTLVWHKGLIIQDCF